jgi:LAO/AO transport system kinase
MTDFFLLLMIAGAGDELQGIKRGIIEMVDCMAINKADGDNKPRAERARVEFAAALHLFPLGPEGWAPKVVTCSAVTGEGIAGIWDTVLEHHRHLMERGLFEQRRREQALAWMRELIAIGLEDEFRHHPGIKRRLPELEGDVRSGRTSSFGAARELLGMFIRGGKPSSGV